MSEQPFHYLDRTDDGCPNVQREDRWTDLSGRVTCPDCLAAMQPESPLVFSPTAPAAFLADLKSYARRQRLQDMIIEVEQIVIDVAALRNEDQANLDWAQELHARLTRTLDAAGGPLSLTERLQNVSSEGQATPTAESLSAVLSKPGPY